MGILSRIKYKAGYRNGYQTSNTYWKLKYQTLEDEKKEIENDFENHKKNHKKRVEDIDKAMKISSDLIPKIRGIEMWINTTLQNEAQNVLGFTSTLTGKLNAIDVDYNKAKKLMR